MNESTNHKNEEQPNAHAEQKQPAVQPQGDVTIVQVGESSRNIAAGKNILQIGTLMIPIWLIALVALVVVVGLILGIPQVYQLARTQVPFLSCRYPYPMPKGTFNVVMAPFTHFDADGRPLHNGDGNDLAQTVFVKFRADFNELNLQAGTFELRGPNEACAIQGATPAMREQNAVSMATQIDADVIIYGVIAENAEGAKFQPEFFVSYEGFEEAVELTGRYELGRPVTVIRPYPDGLTEHPLNVRSRVLSLITLGLAAYTIDHFDRAIDYFIQAVEMDNWDAGKEIVYVLLGNSYARKATKEKDRDLVHTANRYYEQALAENKDFARAVVGQGSAAYQLAIKDFANPNIYDIDLSFLDQAEQFLLAATEKPAPASAHIGPKVNFILGQVYLLRYWIFNGDWATKAINKFDLVIEEFNQHDEKALEHIAGHAYARLGLLAQHEGKPNEAITNYTEAVRLVSGYWQPKYNIELGRIYEDQGQFEEARAKFNAARDIAELYLAWDVVEEAEAALDTLPNLVE